jgi:hypothetical protein
MGRRRSESEKMSGRGLEFLCGVAAPQLNSNEYGLSVSDRIYMEPINQILEPIYRLRMELAKTIFEFHGTSSRGGEPPATGRLERQPRFHRRCSSAKRVWFQDGILRPEVRPLRDRRLPSFQILRSHAHREIDRCAELMNSVGRCTAFQ